MHQYYVYKRLTFRLPIHKKLHWHCGTSDTGSCQCVLGEGHHALHGRALELLVSDWGMPRRIMVRDDIGLD